MKNKKNDFSGKGVYIYENNTNADLMLPKLNMDNKKFVGPHKIFKGDSYFLRLVRTNELKLIQVIDNGEEKPMNENKLILDQPDIVKSAGKIEHVQTSSNVPMNDSKNNLIDDPDEKKDILLNENPSGSIEIVIN